MRIAGVRTRKGGGSPSGGLRFLGLATGLCGRLGIGFALLGLALAMAGPAAAAAPQIVSTYVVENTAVGATLAGEINPNGTATTFRFESLSLAAYEENLVAQPPRDPFFGAAITPAGGAGPAGSGSSPNKVSGELSGLAPETSYRYRLRATNSLGESVVSPVRPFATQPPTNAFELLDHRGWEMVSPFDKGGGAVQPPGTVSGGGVFQAAAGGGYFTFSSADSFGADVQGAPSGSQYLATRLAAGWTTTNVTTPLLSGSYGSEPNGVPYQLFSNDLALALLSNGERCRGQVQGECPVANPPLPGTDAPPGYRNYYRRTPGGRFETVLPADFAYTLLSPEEFEIRVVAATPDLAHVVLSSCAALTVDAGEVPAPGGCDPAAQNLYVWSPGGLSLINRRPGETTGTPGAEIAAPSGAISGDGSRIYFSQGGDLFLRDGSLTRVVTESPGARFAAASTDGSIAYLIDAGSLERYSAGTGSLEPIAPGPGVEGVLGASADGSKVYFAEAGAVFLWDGSAVTEVASSALPNSWPAATGTARVSVDGSHLLFLSTAELTGYPSSGKVEVFLYGPPPGGGAPLLTCVSCDPGGKQPQADASIPGARANGSGPGAIQVYKPRNLSEDGSRVFFESADKLVSQDTSKGVTDVYEWEAEGKGTCARAGGCVQLVSGGRSQDPAYFLDADADGGEAFFLTSASLYPLDPGSYDVYVAREGGGFAIPEPPLPCVADACQVLPPAPEDPSPGTLNPTSGNPPLRVLGVKGKGHKGKKQKHRRKHRKHRGGKR